MPASFEAAITRRTYLRLQQSALCAAVAGIGSQSAKAQGPAYDLVLRNARIVDGTGRKSYRGDIAIRGDTIARISPSIADPAVRVIDAGSQVVAPGFVDIHNHGRVGIFRLPTADNLVRQGVTTAIEGPDGFSPVPLEPFFKRLAALDRKSVV